VRRRQNVRDAPSSPTLAKAWLSPTFPRLHLVPYFHLTACISVVCDGGSPTLALDHLLSSRTEPSCICKMWHKTFHNPCNALTQYPSPYIQRSSSRDKTRCQQYQPVPTRISAYIVHRESASVRKGAKLSYESQSACWHLALGTLNHHIRRLSARRALSLSSSPALQPLALAIPAAPAFAHCITTFLFRLGRLGLEKP
jgi:hypothetical protein